MVVNNFKMADGRHFDNRYIAISQWKIIRFSWKQQILNWMNVTWSTIKRLHWTDSEFDRTYFLCIKYNHFKIDNVTKISFVKRKLIRKNVWLREALTRSKKYRGILLLFWIFEFTEGVLCDITTLVKTIYNLLRNPSEYERCNTVYMY